MLVSSKGALSVSFADADSLCLRPVEPFHPRTRAMPECEEATARSYILRSFTAFAASAQRHRPHCLRRQRGLWSAFRVAGSDPGHGMQGYLDDCCLYSLSILSFGGRRMQIVFIFVIPVRGRFATFIIFAALNNCTHTLCQVPLELSRTSATKMDALTTSGRVTSSRRRRRTRATSSAALCDLTQARLGSLSQCCRHVDVVYKTPTTAV